MPEVLAKEELEAALAALPQWRRRKALSYRFDADRYCCAKAYLLLREMLEEHFGIAEAPVFAFESGGKPLLEGHPEIHFNLSHCRKAVLCAVGDIPLGVDVEVIQYDEDVARSAFSPAELDEIRRSDKAELAFTQLWTKKESLAKLCGEGIGEGLETLLERLGGNVRFCTEVEPVAGVVATVASTL